MVERAYVPANDAAEKYKILGTDVSDLIQTIDHNIMSEPSTAFFQRKVSYNAIPKASLPHLKEELALHAQSSLENLNELLASHDSDANTELEAKGENRIGVGIYYFEEIKEDES